MKIGIDIRNIGKKRTGDEVVFFNLVKNLVDIDQQNEYFLFTDILEENILQDIKNDLGIENKNNFQIISLKSANKFIWNIWTLPNYLKKNLVDIYHTQYILPFRISKNIKLITTIHDVSFNAFPELIKLSDLFFLKLLIPRSLKRADKIIAVSEFTKSEIIKYYKMAPEKIKVAYNAVGDDFLSDVSQEKLEEIKRKYNLPENFILYIGTLQPRKNLPILIEAFASSKLGQSYKLVLCGNKDAHNFDEKIDEIIEKNNLSNNIIFPGFIDEKDKPAIYKSAGIFCYPSLYEGFGIPILEAFASGTPALVSDIPPHREIAGDGSLFFDPKNFQDLSEKLLKISVEENLRNDLARRGKFRLNDFSWKKTAEKTLQIYKNC